jgi:hypothetical protein
MPGRIKSRDFKDSFDGIKYMHVHKKFNFEAYSLSKKALDYFIGWLFFEEYIEGSVVSADKYFLF